MAHKIALWASFIVLPSLVIVAGPSLMSGFGVGAPASADALAVVRNGGFIASCAPAFAAYAKASDADAIRCTHDHGEAVMAISFAPPKDAPQSTDNNQVALAIPVEYAKRFQDRTVTINISAKCPKAICSIIASVDTGYTERPHSRRLHFAGDFTNGAFEIPFPARNPDTITDGPTVSFMPSGENADFDLIVRSVTMALTDD